MGTSVDVDDELAGTWDCCIAIAVASCVAAGVGGAIVGDAFMAAGAGDGVGDGEALVAG